MFLDTSGLLCYQHRRAPQHVEAVQLFQTASTRLTHSYVIVEFVALARARRIPIAPVLDFVDELEANPLVDVVYVDRQLHQEGLRLLRQRADKTWSLCDA